MDAARAAERRIGIGNRLGGKQRALQGFGRRDVGRVGARAGDHGHVVRNRFAVLDEAVDPLRGDDDDIGGFAILDTFHRPAGSGICDRERVSGLALERRPQVLHDHPQRVDAQHFEFRCFGRDANHQLRRWEIQPTHERSPQGSHALRSSSREVSLASLYSTFSHTSTNLPSAVAVIVSPSNSTAGGSNGSFNWIRPPSTFMGTLWVFPERS